jgi:aminopeptidase-like protein
MNSGEIMYGWAKELYPIHRSLTGKGVRETLGYVQKILPNLEIHSVKSNTAAFDWKVPQEWEITEAYIENENKERIIDLEDNNLHVVSYSCSVDKWLHLDELQNHLHSLPNQPDAIPYITSYYTKNWGFCMTHSQRMKLSEGKYHVVVKSRLFDGQLNFGEIIIPGVEDKEVMLATYICHPAMGNNETSGIVVTMQLAKWLLKTKRRYTYRILFIPETIGSITYLSINNNLKRLKDKVIAGFQVTCVGDNNSVSYLKSKYDHSLPDKVVKYYLSTNDIPHKAFSFLERGSDERQWSSPGVDLPFVSLMRSKYLEYPEYHTSLDNINYISALGLEGGYTNIKECISILEANKVFKSLIICEPQLGSRGLYPTVSTLSTKSLVRDMTNFLTYCDGTNDVIDISQIINVNFEDCIVIAEKLLEEQIIIEVHD